MGEIFKNNVSLEVITEFTVFNFETFGLTENIYWIIPIIPSQSQKIAKFLPQFECQDFFGIFEKNRSPITCQPYEYFHHSFVTRSFHLIFICCQYNTIHRNTRHLKTLRSRLLARTMLLHVIRFVVYLFFSFCFCCCCCCRGRGLHIFIFRTTLSVFFLCHSFFLHRNHEFKCLYVHIEICINQRRKISMIFGNIYINSK